MIRNIEYPTIAMTNLEKNLILIRSLPQGLQRNKFEDSANPTLIKLYRNTLYKEDPTYHYYPYQLVPGVDYKFYINWDDFFKRKMRLKRQAITVTQSVDGTTATTFNITPLIYRILIEVAGPIFSQVIGGIG